MGVLGDVINPINDMIEPTEGLGLAMVNSYLIPLLHQVRVLLVDLQIKVLTTEFQYYR